jgi:hypothetical protein
MRRISLSELEFHNNISVSAMAITFCLCLYGLNLLQLKTKASKGRNNPFEAKDW